MAEGGTEIIELGEIPAHYRRLSDCIWYEEKNMATLGGWEWVIILVIVLLVFGVGRISKLGSELGKGITAFRQGMREGQEAQADDEADKEK